MTTNPTPSPRAAAASPSWSLRSITAADHAALHALWARCEDVQPRLLAEVQSLERYLTRNAECCYLAASDHQTVVGCIFAGHDGLRGSLHHLAVDPDWRRRGIARALALRALEALKAAGMSMSTVWIYDRNHAGQAFWQALGYQRWDSCSTWSLRHDTQP